MPTTIARLVAGATLVVTLVACPSPTTANVTRVTILGGDLTLAQSTTLTLTATVETTGNASGTVTWTSSDESVATIDATGLVTTHTSGTTTITATSTADPSQSDSITITVDPPGTLAWTRQFGTSSNDLVRGIATDTNGNVYAAGSTSGALEGASAGDVDAFLRSYDKDGTHRWTRQFGTSAGDVARGITTDTNGNVYAAGYTSGALDRTFLVRGGRDAFIRSYDSDGNHRWTRQFGTTSDDLAYGIATDANGNVYITGYTLGALESANAGSRDAFLRSYDSDGTHRWTRQFGTSTSDSASGIATDANGNVYAAGRTNGDLEGSNAGSADAFVRSYDNNGDHRWTRQFGTSSNDVALGVGSDGNGTINVAGYTFGDLEGSSAGNVDAFVRSYDNNGDHRWTRQFGTSSNDVAEGVTTANGTVNVGGWTGGDLEGSNAGFIDAFARSFEASGDDRWTRQFGTSSDDVSYGIATDTNGNVYATGRTEGSLEGTTAGGNDAFIRKYGP